VWISTPIGGIEGGIGIRQLEDVLDLHRIRPNAGEVEMPLGERHVRRRKVGRGHPYAAAHELDRVEAESAADLEQVLTLEPSRLALDPRHDVRKAKAVRVWTHLLEELHATDFQPATEQELTSLRVPIPVLCNVSNRNGRHLGFPRLVHGARRFDAIGGETQATTCFSVGPRRRHRDARPSTRREEKALMGDSSKAYYTHQTITRGGSSWRRYQRIMIGSHSLAPSLFYEFCIMLAPVSGALGLVLRKLFWPRLFGACGPRVQFGSGIVLRHPRRIHLGERVVISEGCVLDGRNEGSEEAIVLGDDVMGAPYAVLEGKAAKIRIGARCGIGAQAIILAADGNDVTIGADVAIGPRCNIVGGGIYNEERLDVPMWQQGVKTERPVCLEDDIWLGACRHSAQRRAHRARQHRGRRCGGYPRCPAVHRLGWRPCQADPTPRRRWSAGRRLLPFGVGGMVLVAMRLAIPRVSGDSVEKVA
jgi:acetyltransferase-like isoleucine patch superfamily enzyme